MNEAKLRRLAPVMVITAASCRGMIGIFSRNLSRLGFSSIQSTCMRAIITAVLLALFLALHDRKLLRISKKALPWAVLSGTASIAFFNVCYMQAIELLPLSLAVLLLYTAPAIVLVLSRLLFKEDLGKRKLIALGLSLVGCALVCGVAGGGVKVTPVGLLWGLGAGFGYALYSIFSHYGLPHCHVLTYILYTFVFAGLALLPLSQPTQLLSLCLQPQSILFLLLIATVSTAVPYLLYTEALLFMPAGKASVTAFAEPLVATLCGVVVFHEALTLSIICGMGLIFVSLLLINSKQNA